MENYFSKNLKYLRDKKGLEQQELADELNVPRSTLSCWENGIRTPKIEQIQDIAEYFDVSIDIISRDYSNDGLLNSTEYDIFLQKIKDLPPDKQRIILNVADSIIKEIDKEIDGER